MSNNTISIYCWKCKKDVRAEVQAKVEVLDPGSWLVHLSTEAVCPDCGNPSGPSWSMTVRLSS